MTWIKGAVVKVDGRWTKYLLPHYDNIRRVFVDDRTTPLTVWIGNNHAASIIKLELLD